MTLELTPRDIEITIQLMIAAFLGGLIGVEREYHGKEAGFRTYALVTLGSAMFMVLSIEMYSFFGKITTVDPGRIAAQVVTGIGFLGAGAIIRYPTEIKGLTTAAGIWTAAGIGLACGMGHYVSAIITTALALFILLIYAKINRKIFRGKDN